jgi:hypothetical protein
MLVGRPAIDNSAAVAMKMERAEREAEAAGGQVREQMYVVHLFPTYTSKATAGATHSADVVPIEIAHCVTPEMWRSFFEDLQNKYDASGYSKFLLCHGGCTPCFGGSSCGCLPCGPENSASTDCSMLCCFSPSITSDTNSVCSKHAGAFEAAGCEITNLGMSKSRYEWTGGESASTRKLFAARTLCIKFKPNNPNPQAPAPTHTHTPTAVVDPAAVYPIVTQGEVGKPANGDLVKKMLGLKELLDGGVLTQEEFDTKKGELLGQM